MATVSVVIPAYNAAKTLAPTIESVQAQSYQDLEVIVVDDGSSDETMSVAAGFGPPVQCVRTANGGVSRARNRGLEEATGELVAFLDADDLWKPEKLEYQVRLLEGRPEAGISTTGSTKVDEGLTPLAEAPAVTVEDPCQALLLNSMVLGQISSALVRRSLAIESGGFDERLSQCADWDFFIRLARRTEFAVIAAPLVLYRVAATNMSRNIPLLERDTLQVLDRFFASDEAQPYEGIRRRSYSNHWMILSGSYLQAGDWGSATRCMLRGLRAHPANIRRPLGVLGGRLRRIGSETRARAQ